MHLIPVLDLQHGMVVRGVGGRRSEYRPLVSSLTHSCLPFDVARAFVDAFQPRELYIADLDAIAGRGPSWPDLLKASDRQTDLWIDAGIRTERDIDELNRSQVAGIVLGLETINGPHVLDAVIASAGAERILFSLDLRGGRMLGDWGNWGAVDDCDWTTVMERVVRAGARRLIVLDLERVGEGNGIGTEATCRSIIAKHPGLEVICGGGVRNVADLHYLQECGVAGVLVASALHDRRIKPGDWPPAV